MKMKKKLIFVFIIFSINLLIFYGCGKKPTELPPVQYGSLKIEAEIDTTNNDTLTIDSLHIELDGEELDSTYSNPALLENIIVGTHQFKVYWENYKSNSFYATVHSKKVDSIDVSLKEYIYAPDFTGNDLNDNTITLSDYLGKYIVLYFFQPG